MVLHGQPSILLLTELLLEYGVAILYTLDLEILILQTMLDLTLIVRLIALGLLLVLQMSTLQVLLQLYHQGMQLRLILVHDLHLLLQLMIDALFMGDHGFRLTKQVPNRILPLGVHVKLYVLYTN